MISDLQFCVLGSLFHLWRLRVDRLTAPLSMYSVVFQARTGRLQTKQAENLLHYLKMVAQLLLSMILVTSFLLGHHTLMKSKVSFNAFCNTIKNPLLTNIVTLRWLLSYITWSVFAYYSLHHFSSINFGMIWRSSFCFQLFVL